MPQDQLRLSPTEREDLVAYVDGELPDAVRDSITAKLTQSASARHEVDVLRKVWDFLEYLPRPRAPSDFTTKTLTLATGDVTVDDRLTRAAGHTGRLIMRLAVVAASIVASFALTYSMVRWAIPDRTAELARQLSIAEHLDEYQEIGSYEFLQSLDEVPEFHRTSE